MKTFEFTEQEAELLRKEQYKYLINDNIDHFLLLVQQIVSERITPEAGESVKPVPSIPIVGGGSVASDRTEQCESGQSADGGIAIMEILQPIHRHPFDAESGREMEIWYTHKDVWNAMTTYASQVCADKDARIKELEGLLSSDSVYGLFRFAYKSPESAQVYEISKKLRELKTK